MAAPWETLTNTFLYLITDEEAWKDLPPTTEVWKPDGTGPIEKVTIEGRFTSGEYGLVMITGNQEPIVPEVPEVLEAPKDTQEQCLPEAPKKGTRFKRLGKALGRLSPF